MPLGALAGNTLGTLDVHSWPFRTSFVTSPASFAESANDDDDVDLANATLNQSDADEHITLQVPTPVKGVPQVFSQDTNISASDIYDAQRQYLKPDGEKHGLRALDLGAGAGVSTSVLKQLGYEHIDSVDQSDTAWMQSGANKMKDVKFHKATADDFIAGIKSKDGTQYDAVNVAYGLKDSKAIDYAERVLARGGKFLVPITTSEVVERPGKIATRWHLVTKDGSGNVHDKDLPDKPVGGGQMKFQPDITSFDIEPFRVKPQNAKASGVAADTK